jgi:putative oxidoreductase
LCLGIALIYFGSAVLLEKSSEPVTVAQSVIAAVGGAFMLAGLWTPVIGGVVALNEVAIALSPYPSGQQTSWIFLTVLAIGVAMLGPGAWSVDALLFGRKRLQIDRPRKKRPSL